MRKIVIFAKAATVGLAARISMETVLALGVLSGEGTRWVGFSTVSRSHARGTLFLDVVIIVLAIALIIKSTKPGATVAYLVYGFSALICLFSQLYWGYGTAGNFSIRLSRGDALYFAIGTLTTAGTGNISATSGIAREIQALQMMLDLALLGFAVALAISRLASQAQESSDT